MIDREFRCEARVTFNGRELALNKIVAHIDLETLIPPRIAGFAIDDLALLQEREERRARFVNLISAEFAHALTEALYKARV